MRVLVCGGRDYNEYAIIASRLDRLHRNYPIDTIIEGGASGADSCARRWADSRGVKRQTYNAEWKLHGKVAGPIRNTRMLIEGAPNLVIAFYGGRGTADMVDKAKIAGIEVLDLREKT